MKRRFLFKNLFSFLIPAFVPVLIFSVVISVLAFQYTRQEEARVNNIALAQSQTRLEQLFNTAGRIGVDISSSNTLPIIMKGLLQKTTIPYEKYNNFQLVKNYLQMQLSVDPAIMSIYVYISNPYGQFFVSNGSLSSFSSFYDVSWYDTYLDNLDSIDSYYELRAAQSYFASDSQSEFLTLYYNLYYPGRTASDGVIVVNLRLDAIRASLDTLAGHPESTFMIVEGDGDILCTGNNTARVLHLDALPTHLNIETINRNFLLSSIASSVFPWCYYLITPNSYAYRLPRVVTWIMIVFLIGCLLLAFALSYLSSLRSSHSLMRIMEILDQSKSDHPDPIPPNAPRDSYDYIIQHLLEVFMKQNYLKVQLSEKHYRLQVMELLALQSQINPHFLYNTLQTIYLKVLSYTGTPNEVNHMLEHLMIILRYSLSNPVDMALLSEDLKCARSYVYLEQHQYGRQLCVRWHLNNLSEDIDIPKLLIQPLVENCIRHGMRSDGAPLEIDIFVNEVDSYVHIEIADNGRGVSKEACEQICCKLNMALSGELEDVDAEHIGLFNTARRLHLNYPGQCKMTFSSVEGMGTRVSIHISERIIEKQPRS